MTVTIRPATAADEPAWRNLWAQYLAFYRVPLPPEVTNATWARILAPESRLACLIGESSGSVQGFAVWHSHVASWSLKDDCYLEDLFVAEPARGTGLGRALIDALIQTARDTGSGRIYWHTDEGNARARALYDSYTPNDGHIRYRILL
jgi:GNAT superfamily N-acetyltransferase